MLHYVIVEDVYCGLPAFHAAIQGAARPFPRLPPKGTNKFGSMMVCHPTRRVEIGMIVDVYPCAHALPFAPTPMCAHTLHTSEFFEFERMDKMIAWGSHGKCRPPPMANCHYYPRAA